MFDKDKKGDKTVSEPKKSYGKIWDNAKVEVAGDMVAVVLSVPGFKEEIVFRCPTAVAAARLADNPAGSVLGSAASVAKAFGGSDK